jgi:hypothetical protein
MISNCFNLANHVRVNPHKCTGNNNYQDLSNISKLQQMIYWVVKNNRANKYLKVTLNLRL